MNMDTDELVARADAVVQQLRPHQPACALVLGSGWSDVCACFEERASLPYDAVPLLGTPTVKGHAGRLLLGAIDDTEFLVFQGRRHWYEGAGWNPVAFPLFCARACGAGSVLLTNAAGGARDDLSPGDLMIIDDHINAMGVNPLVGAPDPSWPAPFPDQTRLYAEALRHRLDVAAGQAGIPVSHGVYLATTGPAYETPAEVRAFRSIGADAVGMSTVPEAMIANAIGLPVAGLSCITNRAAGTGEGTLSHEEVVAVSQAVMPRMRDLIAAFCRSFVAPVV